MAGAQRRRVVLEHVRRRPGSTIVDVSTTAGVTHPTATYHLAALEAEGRVESERYGNKRHYFEAGAFDAWERRFVALVLGEENARVLKALWAAPATYGAAVAAEEQVSRLTVAAAAKRFEEMGLVQSVREGRVRTLVANRNGGLDRVRRLFAKLPRDAPAAVVLREFVPA